MRTTQGMTFTLAIILGMVAICQGCAPVSTADATSSVPSFIQITHARSENSARSFPALCAETIEGRYEIEKSAVSDEVQATEIVNTADADIRKLRELLPGLEFDKPSVCIVTADLLTGKALTASYCLDGVAVTTTEYIASKEYLGALICAAGVAEPWVAYGLAAQINGSTPDSEALAAYYSDEENMDTLDLFGARFFSTVAGEDTVIARETAASLTDFMLRRYGESYVESLIGTADNPDLTSVKNDWLAFIGVTTAYHSAYEGVFTGYRFERSGSFDIVITAPFAIYEIVMQDEERCLLTSASNIEAFLYKNKMGVEELIRRLADIPCADLLELDNVIVYDIDETADPPDVYTNKHLNIVFLHTPYIEYGHLHEAVHVYTPYNAPDKEYEEIYAMLVEGFACYMTTAVTNEYSCWKTDMSTGEFSDVNYLLLLRVIDKNCDGSTFANYYTDPDKIEKLFTEYYFSNGGSAESLNSFNPSLYMDALSYAINSIYEDNPTDKPGYRYPLYESFVTYLVNTYSLEQVIRAISDCTDTDKIFGKSPDELLTGWKAYLVDRA